MLLLIELSETDLTDRQRDYAIPAVTYKSRPSRVSRSGHSTRQLKGFKTSLSRFVFSPKKSKIRRHSRTSPECRELKMMTASLTKFPHISARCLALLRPPFFTLKVMLRHNKGWNKQPRHLLHVVVALSRSVRLRYERISTIIMLGSFPQSCAAIFCFFCQRKIRRTT